MGRYIYLSKIFSFRVQIEERFDVDSWVSQMLFSNIILVALGPGKLKSL